MNRKPVYLNYRATKALNPFGPTDTIAAQYLDRSDILLKRCTSRFEFFSDFLNTIATQSSGMDIRAVNNGTGAATSQRATDAANRVGLVRSGTGTTSTGRTGVSSAITAIRLSGGQWYYRIAVNVSVLSTVSERFQFIAGFQDSNSSSDQTDGVFFLYDEGGVSSGSAASANWQCVTSNNSSRTFTTTSSAVGADTWVNLSILVNAAATSVGFYINDVLVATHTTNIPTGSGRLVGFGWLLIKSAGTTERTVDIDYLMVQCDFTNSR